MSVFTVIGFWPDTNQRFATYVKAASATEAEAKCADHHEGVAICGIVRGRHQCAETKSEMIYNAPYDQ